MRLLAFGMGLMVLGSPVLAQDAAHGAEIFDRQCVACHVVVNDAGETLAGRNAHVGPNLYGAVGRQPGTYPDFEYGDDMIAYGETGVVWSAENLIPYVQDPTGFLREALDDRRARGKMAFQLRSETDAQDIFAFLSTFAADGAATDAAATEEAPAEGEEAPSE